MDNILNVSGMPLYITSEDNVEYEVTHFEASLDNIEELWERTGKLGVLFHDKRYENSDFFFQFVTDPRNVILIVKDFGVFFFNVDVLNSEAMMYFNFWDRTTNKRHGLILGIIQWVFEVLEIRRINYVIPRTDFAALSRARFLGFKLEGIKRSCILRNRGWSDLCMFGILASEVDDKAVSKRRLFRSADESTWYTQLVGEDKHAREQFALPTGG
jgi:hypothetical protein